MSQGRYIAYPFRGTTVRSAARLLNVVNDKMIFEITAFLALAIWCYVALGRGGFWRCAERDDGAPPPPAGLARGAVILSAPDEAPVIRPGPLLLLRAGYSWSLSGLIVHDNSRD